MEELSFMSYVYIFQNDWMPALVKIGITDNIEQRLRDSAKDTFVPQAFTCYYAIQSDIGDKLEAFIQDTFDTFRVNSKREFFEMGADKARRMLKGLVDIGVASEVNEQETINITNNVQKELEDSGEQIYKRKRNTTFEMLNIDIGTELSFRNNTTIKCKTIDKQNQVIYDGQQYSISTLATQMVGYRVSGFDYFCYNGKTLGDMRREIDAESD
jgi:hypothetical protein